MKTITSEMILYYNKPESETEKIDIFVDFATIHQKVHNRYPAESTLYRLLRKKCHSVVRYQNRDLYPLEELSMILPEIYKELKKNG